MERHQLLALLAAHFHGRGAISGKSVTAARNKAQEFLNLVEKAGQRPAQELHLKTEEFAPSQRSPNRPGD